MLHSGFTLTSLL